MKKAMDETERRRKLQADYNKKMKITPETIKSSIKDILGSIYESDYYTVAAVAEETADYNLNEDAVKRLEAEMKEAARKLDFERAGLYPGREYVFGACAAAAIYRRAAIEEIGFFDEDFFLQCEDSDLSFRLQLAGWKVLYVPDAVVYHKVSHAIGRISDVGVYYSQRNMEFLRIKNVPLALFIMYLPHMIIGYVVEFFYFGIRHMKWKLFIKAKIDALKLFPAMLRKRKYIIKKVDNKYIRSLITPMFADRSFVFQKLRKFWI
jgi:GT2 family glycosyltransferase